MYRLFAISAAALLGLGVVPAAAQDPYALPDESWISISGTVASPAADSFMLDYGDGLVTVEMDRFGLYDELHETLDGHQVTVYGAVDADFFETTTIEASTVYDQSLNTYFYSSAMDEDDPVMWVVTGPVVISQTVVSGEVTAVDPVERQFALRVGDQTLTVETGFLGYDPLDDFGYQQIDVGDRVSVTGMVDRDFLEGRVLEAVAVTTLSEAAEE